MPKAPPSSSSRASSSTASAKLTPKTYRALKTEQGVFTTPPYSALLKPLWRFKDEDTAKESAQKLWERFEVYLEQDDFVGMDITRKFIQMGRTRSLRYALRKGGRKYETSTSGPASRSKGKAKSNGSEDEEEDNEKARSMKKEIPRTGEVYDEEKLKGANIFEGYLGKCWECEVYKRAWEDWRDEGKRSGSSGSAGTSTTRSTSKVHPAVKTEIKSES